MSPLPLTLKSVTFTAILAFAPATHSADDWTPLLDKDLSRWEIWMGVPHTSVEGLPAGTHQANRPQEGPPLGLGHDPKGVFSVAIENGEPVLQITGEIYGGLTTLAEFTDFHFSAQVKFGPKKWEPRLDRKRDSGFLYHCVGPHGAFWNVWKRCVEFQVQETDMGDLYMLAGTGGDVRFRQPEGDEPPLWDPTQPYQPKGRVRRSADFENPHGEWTTIEIYAVGDQAIHVVNGHVVLAIDNIRQREVGSLTKGQFQIQSEGAEVYYRDVKVRSISAIPAALAIEANL